MLQSVLKVVAVLSFLSLSVVVTSSASAYDEPATDEGHTSSGSSNSDFVDSQYSGSSSVEDSDPFVYPRSGSSSLARWPWFTNCEHTGDSDDVHISTSFNRTDVSVHGWWRPLNNECPEKANVWVALQVYRCGTVSEGTICYWHTVNKSKPKLLWPGTGNSAARVNARFTCVTRRSVSWRAVVDVDIPGEIDGSEKYYSRAYDIPCTSSL